MTRRSMQPLLTAMALAALSASALAQSGTATPWVLAPHVGYGYDAQFRTTQHKMGTNNAGLLLKGAKRVPKNTLFFIGADGHLYMRSGPFLDSNGSFMFGPAGN